MGAGQSSPSDNNNNNNMSDIEREQMMKMKRHMLAKKQMEQRKQQMMKNNMAYKQKVIHNNEHNRVLNETYKTQNKMNQYHFSSNNMREMVKNRTYDRMNDRLNVSSRKPIYKERVQPKLQVHNKEKSKYSSHKTTNNAEIARGINNIEDFEASEKRLEEDFKRSEQQRRKQFMREKEKRKKAFQGELNKFKKSKFDPYKILSLNKNFTLAQLKRSYKKMAMKTHPDKGGDPRVFKVITKSYIFLLDEHKKRENNHSYSDMREDSNKYMSGQSTEAPVHLNDDNGGFNINRFNKLYSEHRMDTPEDAGYGDWINDTSPSEKSTKPLFSDGFNLDIFNSVFNDERDTNSQVNSVVKYHKPNALVSSSGVGCVELGRGKIKDFSSDGTSTIMGHSHKKTLQFTDYKIAHTKTTITGGRNDRKGYDSIGDLKMDRSNISYTLSSEDARREAEIKRKNEERERRRIERLQERDRQITQHFNRVRNVITGGRQQTLAITNNRGLN